LLLRTFKERDNKMMSYSIIIKNEKLLNIILKDPFTDIERENWFSDCLTTAVMFDDGKIIDKLIEYSKNAVKKNIFWRNLEYFFPFLFIEPWYLKHYKLAASISWIFDKKTALKRFLNHKALKKSKRMSIIRKIFSIINIFF